MQSPLTNSTKSKKSMLTQELRSRFFRIMNEFDRDQLCSFLIDHQQNPPELVFLHSLPRNQLLHQALVFMDTHYTEELEQALYSIKPKRPTPNFHLANQQPQHTPSTSFSEQTPSSYNQQTWLFNPQPIYQFPPRPSMLPPTRSILPASNPLSSTGNHHTFSQPAPPQRPAFNTFVPSFQQATHQSTLSILPRSSSPSSAFSSSSTNISPQPKSIVPAKPTPGYVPVNKINHKVLPFYRPISSVFERYHAFQYDIYRKHYFCHDSFVLSLDASNQLALSYDYDPQSNAHQPSKRLLLRLVRLDQVSMPDGNYDDSLPPNLVVTVNGQNVTSLPVPKPSSREHNDLLRIGREIDITPHCMFNPALKNEFNIIWSYSLENKNLRSQFLSAQYALHIFLVDRLTVNDLCEQILKKPMKFIYFDLMKMLTRARAHDHEEDLEVSDQMVKIICPIDQRRLKHPVRAVTCQHLQCFDLHNYLALNEKSGKWLCPVCNKSAIFDDLQLDSFTESILKDIDDEKITDIIVDSKLQWSPVLPTTRKDDESSIKSRGTMESSPDDIIFLDDDNDN